MEVISCGKLGEQSDSPLLSRSTRALSREEVTIVYDSLQALLSYLQSPSVFETTATTRKVESRSEPRPSEHQVATTSCFHTAERYRSPHFRQEPLPLLRWASGIPAGGFRFLVLSESFQLLRRIS